MASKTSSLIRNFSQGFKSPTFWQNFADVGLDNIPDIRAGLAFMCMLRAHWLQSYGFLVSQRAVSARKPKKQQKNNQKVSTPKTQKTMILSKVKLSVDKNIQSYTEYSQEIGRFFVCFLH